MKFKGNKGAANSIVVMLMVFILILICLLFWLVKNPMVKVVEKEVASTPTPANTTTVETPKTYTCKDLKGKYQANDTLFLFEDGTYDYELNEDAAYGHFGNYIINGNEIILNQLFTHGSDIGVFAEKTQIKGTINNNESIILTLNENSEFKKIASSTSDNYDTLYEAVSNYIKYLEEEINNYIKQ